MILLDCCIKKKLHGDCLNLNIYIYIYMFQAFGHSGLVSSWLLFQAMTSPVVEMWAQNEMLMSRAAVGHLVLSGDRISRSELVSNEDVVIPVLKHMGVRTSVHQILEHVELFFGYARPKGKANLPRSLF